MRGFWGVLTPWVQELGWWDAPGHDRCGTRPPPCRKRHTSSQRHCLAQCLPGPRIFFFKPYIFSRIT